MSIFKKLKETIFGSNIREAYISSSVQISQGNSYGNVVYSTQTPYPPPPPSFLPTITASNSGPTVMEVYHGNIDILAHELRECTNGRRHEQFTKEYLDDAFQKFDNLRPFYLNMLDTLPYPIV